MEKKKRSCLVTPNPESTTFYYNDDSESLGTWFGLYFKAWGCSPHLTLAYLPTRRRRILEGMTLDIYT